MGCGASVLQDGALSAVAGQSEEKKISVASFKEGLNKALSRQGSKNGKEESKEPLPPVTIFFSCEAKHYKQVKELGDLILEKSKTDQNAVKSDFSFYVGTIDRENYTVDDRIGRCQLYVPIVTPDYIRQHQVKRRGERQRTSGSGSRCARQAHHSGPPARRAPSREGARCPAAPRRWRGGQWSRRSCGPTGIGPTRM